MDYVVGGVAALLAGNVTPNRPRTSKRALTPTKHQPSPNVTPKSELCDDRSIFLSPTLQKKKAIVKKSPKRIFQNHDLDVSATDSNTVGPKTDKVKKHLKDDLEAKTQGFPLKELNDDSVPFPKKAKVDRTTEKKLSNENTPNKKKNKVSTKTISDNAKDLSNTDNIEPDISQNNNKIKSPKNKKVKRKSLIDNDDSIPTTSKPVDNKNNDNEIDNNPEHTDMESKQNSKKKRKNKAKIQLNKTHRSEEIGDYSNTTLKDKENQDKNTIGENNEKSIKKNKKHKNKLSKNNDPTIETVKSDDKHITDNTNQVSGKIKKNKNKKPKKNQNKANNHIAKTEEGNDQELNNKQNDSVIMNKNNINEVSVKIKKNKSKVNPNAITNKDSESEHESDNEIESESEEVNKKLLENNTNDSSSDDEEEHKQLKKIEHEKPEKSTKVDADEVKRTLFVGNVLLSKKCKKEIKRIFSKYGQIETVRIRTVPIKDARDTPKLAVIKNELHPDRSTVNVYVKFADPASVDKALAENNTVLNDLHLRVSRSDSTGSEHDPRCSVFVGNMPFALEDEVLRTKFEKCGEIDSVRIIRDRKTNAGKGFGYVNFKSKDGVELALALSEEDLTIKNRILRVMRCTQMVHKHKGNRNNNQQRNRPFGNHGNKYGSGFGGQKRNEPEGAVRRVMNKRKNQEAGEGPPNKRQNMDKPKKEKKQRKEFVGMTADKRKKHKFDKGQKKKKILSEILTKSA